MKKAVLNTLVLVCICAVMTGLLAVTNYFTDPIIQENLAKKAQEALKDVLPEGTNAVDVTAEYADNLPKTVKTAYRMEKDGTPAGAIAEVHVNGFGGTIVVLVAVDEKGAVLDTHVAQHSETGSYGGILFDGTRPGHEDFFERFLGATSDTVSGVDTKTGATISATAFQSAVKDALNAAAAIRGEDVDNRTLEEKLQDALPAAEGKFTKLFIVEVIEGIDAVYTADNGKGSVYVVGEHYIPVDENGGIPVFDSISPEIQQNVAAADVILSATTTEVIDQTAYGEELKYITSAKKTATGNYILEVKGPGYGIVGGDDYHLASGEYIIVRVSMTPDGKIIDTFTVSQAETAGVGDACAKEEFYGQFDGKTESDYKDIDAIGGATMTTSGYLKAIERAFAAVKILEGGSN